MGIVYFEYLIVELYHYSSGWKYFFVVGNSTGTGKKNGRICNFWSHCEI